MSTPQVAAKHRPDAGLGVPWGAVTAFLLPALTFFFFLTAYPAFKTLWNSFHSVLPRGDEFLGLANYAELIRDGIFWRAVGNTFIWAGVSPVLEVTIATLLALAIYAKVPGSRFFRVVWFAPVLFSFIVVGILWTWIYNFDWGPINTALRAVGLETWARPWLSDTKTALGALIFVTTWMWVGFNMVVMLAAIHSVPAEVIEAAELDNCGWGAKLIFVILPLVRGTVLNLLILSFIGKMKIFDLVWVTTKGNPLWATETVSTYTFKRAFEWSTFDLGYPSTIATVWFVIVVGAVLLITRLFRVNQKLEF